MQINKIILNNIRSYENAEIKIPPGLTLLSGNIGAGKSTILLSIDFALFGIQRGELSGQSLLRNGAKEGYVNLDIKLKNKNISIKRSLKRSLAGIAQGSGYLTVNDVTQELTPIELKQKILELLKYPQEILTKKSMIYRYTVYTPQEEMKTILLGDKELRIETLRKVFNIDKYKRIKDNHKILSSELKLRKKESAAFIYDLEDKKLKVETNKNLGKKLHEEIALRDSKIDKLVYQTNISLEKLSNIEQEIKILNDLNKELEGISTSLKLKKEIQTKNQRELSKLLTEIGRLSAQNELKINIQETELKIDNINSLLLQKENETKIISNKITELRTKRINCEEIKDKITKIDNCPLCEQLVSHEHKKNINVRENEKIDVINISLEKLEIKEKELDNDITLNKKLLEELKHTKNNYKLIELKKSDLKSKQEKLEELALETQTLEKEIKTFDLKKLDLGVKIELLKSVEKEYKIKQEQIENLKIEQKQLEIEKARLEQELKNLNSIDKEMRKEIEEKESIKKKLENYIRLQEWMDKFFINLINIMERKVMLKIHNDFNLLFQRWFGIVMNNEIIKVKLNEEFTPLIEQDGHDLEYENLSGGEKSACALSYRLALNQIINNIISHINTKDLIILDEPTDGLSTEQLERIRIVLQELNMNQVIIVSHESKIESFVDNIIKIEKENHISKIV